MEVDAPVKRSSHVLVKSAVGRVVAAHVRFALCFVLDEADLVACEARPGSSIRLVRSYKRARMLKRDRQADAP